MTQINKIDRAELTIVRLPLIHPFETSFAVQTHRDALLLRLISGSFEGWGECVSAPDPYYAYETNTTALHVIEEFLMPLVFGMREFQVDDAVEAFRKIRGHNMAKAAVENALLDLLSRKSDMPLFELLGGSHKKIMSGISIGIKKNTDELLQSIGEAKDKKYGRIKIKIKRGRDVEVLKVVRAAFPDIRLMADANADYGLEDIDILVALDAFDLMMIEQPMNYDDIYTHSIVQKRLKTAVCLDESIKGLNDANTAIALKSCRIINIKQGRVGGLLAARAIQETCARNGMPVWSGGMLETGIGRAFNIHLQTLDGFVLPGDTSETARYFEEDIVDKPVVLDADGFIEIPAGPGTGVQVLTDRIQKLQSFHKRLSP